MDLHTEIQREIKHVVVRQAARDLADLEALRVWRTPEDPCDRELRLHEELFEAEGWLRANGGHPVDPLEFES